MPTSKAGYQLQLETLLEKITYKMEYDRTHTLNRLKGTFWSEVNRKISHHTLLEVCVSLSLMTSTPKLNTSPLIPEQAYKQYQKSLSLDKKATCSYILSSSQVLPCSHFIKDLIGSKRKLTAAHFDSHWQLDQSSVQPVLHLETVSLEKVLDNIHERYKNLPAHQQGVLQDQLLQILDKPTPTVSDPVAIQPRGRPVGSLNRSKCDRSAFEYHESRQKGPRCGQCHQRGHNKRTCLLSGPGASQLIVLTILHVVFFAVHYSLYYHEVLPQKSICSCFKENVREWLDTMMG